MKNVRDLINFFAVRSPLQQAPSAFGRPLAVWRGFIYFIFHEMSLWKAWLCAIGSFGLFSLPFLVTYFCCKDFAIFQSASSVLVPVFIVLGLMVYLSIAIAVTASVWRLLDWLFNSPRVLGSLSVLFIGGVIFTIFAYPEAWGSWAERWWADSFNRYFVYLFAGLIALSIVITTLATLVSFVSRYYHRKKSALKGGKE